MLEFLKPYGRALKYSRLYRSAMKQSRKQAVWDPSRWARPPVYIVGCGRSGTTILGALFSEHPGVNYYFEPYHVWAAIDPHTDMTNMYTTVLPRCILTQDDCTGSIQARFEAIFGSELRKQEQRVVEKTPIHALRLLYLSTIAPQCVFIYMQRRCEDVASSIEILSSRNTYKIYGKQNMHQWWGINDIKWNVLHSQGESQGYTVPEIPAGTTDHWLRGVYEWYCTERYVADCVASDQELGHRILRVQYEDLLREPHNVLQQVERYIDVEPDASWLEAASSRMRPQRVRKHKARHQRY